VAIDFVQHPEEWSGRGAPAALINIVAKNLNYTTGEQQIVGGNVSGVLAQGSANVTALHPFPIAELHALLIGNAEAPSSRGFD
jgi:hypothetical protein